MARLRLIALILVLVLSACSAGQPAATPTLPATATLALPTATSTPAPTQTASPAPSATPTLAPTDTATIQPSATSLFPAGFPTTMDCASYPDPNVKVTVPDGVGPYKILCIGMSGSTGVSINALGMDNKAAPKAIFAVPIKVCLKGHGSIMGMDVYNNSFMPTNLKAIQEGDFTCTAVTKTGSVILNP